MGFIVTPGQLKAQGEFYHQLATMTSAGVTIAQALDLLRKSPPSRKLKALANDLINSIARGSTFTEALRGVGQPLPEFDIALIEAGEQSGRLDQCFKLLSEFYSERGRMASEVISNLLYPAFMFHFALLIFPTSLLVGLVWRGETGPFIVSKVAILVPTYGVIFFLLWSFQSQRSRRWRAFMEQLMRAIPLVGSTMKNLALARLSAALEALINAGVTIIEAWDLAARASGSAQIIRAVQRGKPQMVGGELPSDVISAQGIYPELFCSSYRTGEVSGHLDEALRRLYRHYLNEATTGLRRLTEWLPKLIYLGILIGIGYFVISFWAGYFKQINDAIGQ